MRTWLYRIATNVFLDSRKAASHVTVPSGDPLEWSTDLGPYPDAPLADDPQTGLAARETVEQALIAALMYLPARQRAVFVLRDVYGWTPQEIASALDTAVAAVNSLLQRSRPNPAATCAVGPAGLAPPATVPRRRTDPAPLRRC